MKTSGRAFELASRFKKKSQSSPFLREKSNKGANWSKYRGDIYFPRNTAFKASFSVWPMKRKRKDSGIFPAGNLPDSRFSTRLDTKEKFLSLGRFTLYNTFDPLPPSFILYPLYFARADVRPISLAARVSPVLPSTVEKNNFSTGALD